jgi:hypothetical protein
VSPSAPSAAMPGCKSWIRHHKVLTGLGVVIVLFFGSAAVNGIIEGIRNPLPEHRAGTAVDSGAASAAPTASAAKPVAPPPVPAPGKGQSFAAVPTRGLLDTVSYWDRTYQRLPESACAAQGEVKLPIGVLDGWPISSGGIACYNDIGDGTGPPWGGHIVALDVYFPRHVNEQVANRAVAALLPADAQAAGPFPGLNNDTSTKPQGSCQHIVYTSAALAAAVRGANPTWTADPTKADVTFYSGRASSADGSDTPFNPSNVNEILVMIGDGDPHAGSYTC